MNNSKSKVFSYGGILDPVTAHCFSFQIAVGLGLNSGLSLYLFDNIFEPISVKNRKLGWLGGSCYM